MKRGWWILIALIVVVAVAIWALLTFYSRGCENQTCFEDYMKDCRKANYISSGKMVFQYSILGKSGNDCQIRVKLLQGDLTNQESIKLEKTDMICSLPFGVVSSPEADISLCSGKLKEGLQDLVIAKLYAYLVQNMGKINADLIKKVI